MKNKEMGCGSGLLTKILFELSMERKIEHLGFFAFDITKAMLEYLDEGEIRSALSILKDRLTKNGKFILIITRSNMITKYLIEKLWKANSYSKNEMINMLKEVGFEHIKIYRFPAKFWYLNFWGSIFEVK